MERILVFLSLPHGDPRGRVSDRRWSSFWTTNTPEVLLLIQIVSWSLDVSLVPQLELRIDSQMKKVCNGTMKLPGGCPFV